MDKVWILGAGGSMSMARPERREFGGATTCVLVQLDGCCFLLDAGTGILELPAEAMSQPELTLLLTHFHLDHVMGLPMCPYLFQPDRRLTIRAGRHEGMEAPEALGRLFVPPLWPVTLDQFPCRVDFHPFAEPLPGGVRLDVLPGEHPNGVNVLRLTGERHRVVFATDCTLTPENRPALRDFARDCDLLLCDGQYSDEEWAAHRDFGHNTWTAAARWASECGARSFRVTHHDPSHSDAVLTAAEAEVREICSVGRLARQGEEIAL